MPSRDLESIKDKQGKPALFQNIDESLDLQGQLDELYRQAELADKELGRFMSEVIKKFPGIAGAAKHAPLKKRHVAQQKVERRGRDANQLKDIARATIEFREAKDMFAAREYIRNSTYFQQIKDYEGALKDRYTGEQTAHGYRDVKFFLLMPIDGGLEHLVELQLNIKHALMAKKIVHSFYELIRLGGESWSPDNKESQIVVEQSDASELGLKLRSDWVRCKQSGVFKQEVLSPVADMLDTMFIDSQGEPRGNKVVLGNKSDRGVKLSWALSQLCCEIYDYYNKLSNHQLTVPATHIMDK